MAQHGTVVVSTVLFNFKAGQQALCVPYRWTVWSIERGSEIGLESGSLQVLDQLQQQECSCYVLGRSCSNRELTTWSQRSISVMSICMFQ